MDDRHEGMRNVFNALTSRKLSRNKYFAAFGGGWSRTVHRRFRTVQAVATEAERFAGVPGSSFRVRTEADSFRVTMENEPLRYRRTVVLRDYEWQWLQSQSGVRALLQTDPAPGLHGSQEYREGAPPVPIRIAGERGLCN